MKKTYHKNTLITGLTTTPSWVISENVFYFSVD